MGKALDIHSYSMDMVVNPVWTEYFDGKLGHECRGFISPFPLLLSNMPATSDPLIAGVSATLLLDSSSSAACDVKDQYMCCMK